MIRWLLDLLYGSVSAEWESTYPLEESIARLRAATLRSVFSALAEPAAVGTVSESRVKLQRVIPMVGNSFKKEDMGPPVFIKVVFAVAAMFVTIYWWRWWNAQRVHFAVN